MFLPNKQKTHQEPSMRGRSHTRLSRAILLALFGGVISAPVYALESLSEQALSDTTGADGVAINIQANGLTFSNLYYQDQIDNAATPTARQVQLTNATLTANSGTLNAVAQINAGSTGTTPALSINLDVITPFLLAAPRVEICASSASCTNTPLAGGSISGITNYFGLQTTTPTIFSLVTTNGLLNSAGTAKVTLSLNAANIFFTPYNQTTQLVTQNVNVNINSTDGSGKIWISPTDGFRFSGNVNLLNTTAPSASTAGIQASLMLQAPSGTGTTYTPLAAGGLLRFGVSGQLNNTQLYVRGTKGSAANEDSIGSVVGAQGLVARLTGQTVSGALNADGTGTGFQLELSGAGVDASGNPNGYGIQMTNFRGFSNVIAAGGANPTIDSGNIYVNLTNATSLPMPVQSVFTSTTANTVNFFNMTAATFNQAVSGADSALLAVRGLNIQGVPLLTYFYQTGVGRVTNSGTTYNAATGVATTGTTPAAGFALMPVLYGVNANLALSSNSSAPYGLNYAVAVSTTGNNGQTGESGAGSSTDIKTTGIFLADTGGNQYIGLRNINALIQASGVITLTSGVNTATCANRCINISLPNFLLAMSADFAAGYLPGAEPGTAGVSAPGTFAQYASASNTDTLFHINAQIVAANAATNTLSLYTNSNGSLGIGADLTLAGTPAAPGNSFIRLSQPNCVSNCAGVTNGATLGLDNLTGRLQLVAADSAGTYTTALGNTVPGTNLLVGPNGATLNSTLIINPGNVANGELLGTLNFYKDSNTSTASTLGKIVMTGGQIISNLTLKPVNF